MGQETWHVSSALDHLARGAAGPGGHGREKPRLVDAKRLFPEPWTKEEDEALLEQVGAYKGQAVSWAKVADNMPGRTKNSCKGRYTQHLDPTISHEAWSSAEMVPPSSS